MKFNHHVAVVTGATGGLGKVVSRRLAENGAKLALVSLFMDELKALEKEFNLPESQVLSIAADLSQPDAAQRVLDSVISRFGGADILLHFVGGWIGGKPVSQVSTEDVSTMLQQHLWTTFHITRAFSPHLIANRWGRVVIVSSPSVASPPANSAPYAIGKAAQETLMLTLSEEFKGTGVTANILRVRTIDVNHEREHQPSSKNASWTTPEEIADAILFLCSEEASMINGARIPLYGSP